MTEKIYVNRSDLSELSHYKLCYIDKIPKTYMDWNPHSKALMQTQEYKDFREKVEAVYDEIRDRHEKEKGVRYIDSFDQYEVRQKLDPEHRFNIDVCEYINPDYSDGYTHYLYFTDDMDNQWGDDWDDAPFEHNAGTPYDDETNIIIIPVTIEYFLLEKMVDAEKNWDGLYVTCPRWDDIEIRMPNTGYVNSPYSIDMINTGAVPWIYFRICDHKKITTTNSEYIMAGENPKNVIDKINFINRLTYKRD